MKKSSVLLSILVAAALVGCKKKDADKAADKAADQTMGTASATGTGATPPPPPPDPNAGTGAGTGGAMAGTGAAPAAGGGDIPELKALPDGMHDDCKTAYDKMVKYRGCAKHEAKDRTDMVKAWNAAVDGTFVHYKTAKGSMKETIEKTCTSMASTLDMLITGC